MLCSLHLCEFAYNKNFRGKKYYAEVTDTSCKTKLSKYANIYYKYSFSLEGCRELIQADTKQVESGYTVYFHIHKKG